MPRPLPSWRSLLFVPLTSERFIAKAHTRGADAIGARPAVKRGRIVNRLQGDPKAQLHERHDASDFDLKTQDKLEAKG